MRLAEELDEVAKTSDVLHEEFKGAEDPQSAFDQSSPSLQEEPVSSITPGETPTRAPTKSDYCVHQVTMDDSLNTLVIRYGVSKDVIRFANDFSGDEIYMFKKLIIPYSCKP